MTGLLTARTSSSSIPQSAHRCLDVSTRVCAHATCTA